MAVMTTSHPEGIAIEQKTSLPVPASDAMALDLEINGTSIRNETAPESSLPQSDDLSAGERDFTSSVDDLTSTPLAINGNANQKAFDINATATTNVEESQTNSDILESQITEASTSIIDSSPLPNSNTTISDASKKSSAPLEPEVEHQLDLDHASEPSLPQPQDLNTSALLTSADTAIEAAFDEAPVPSSIPPIVDAQQSDLRDTTSSPLPEPASEPMDHPRDDLPELSMATDLDTTVAESITDQTREAVEANIATVSLDPPSSDLPAAVAVTDLPPSLAAKTELDSHDPDVTMNDSTNDASPAAAAADTSMSEAPELPISTKVAREREDDDVDEPSGKRVKTGGDATVNGEDATHVQNGGSTKPIAEDAPEAAAVPITPYAQRELIKILKNAARTKQGKQYRAPVVELWPVLADSYLAKVTNPIDFGTIETKLRNGAYASINDFKADLQLLVDNCVLFNGPDHVITMGARESTKSVLDKIASMAPEPAIIAKEKKQPKPAAADSGLKPSARRQSRGAAQQAPTLDAAASTTFALNPQTSTPLIRRDSTKADGGRPKREIHPPKNKDLVYHVRPKNKKFDTELRWCQEVLNEFKKPKHQPFASAFYQPVDPVALGIPTYFSIIKNPMDIQTIQTKLENGEYSNSKEFEKDVGLILSNCFRFNPPPNAVHAWGKSLEGIYKEQLSKKSQWISEHTPAALDNHPTSDSEEEESEAEPEVVVNTNKDVLTKRLVEEQEKLISLMADKNTDPMIIEMQKEMIGIVKKKVDAEEAAATTAVKKTKKTKAPKAPKKAQVAKKPGKKAGAKAGKEKYLGTLEKEVISAGIASLSEEFSAKVLEMIRADQPNIPVDSDGNVELDIDAVGTPTLWAIYELVVKHAPEVEPEIRRSFAQKEAPRAPAKPAPKKKNKPMSAIDQERKIEMLKEKVQDYERGASGSQEPLPTVETQEESSGDDDSDSEED